VVLNLYGHVTSSRVIVVIAVPEPSVPLEHNRLAAPELEAVIPDDPLGRLHARDDLANEPEHQRAFRRVEAAGTDPVRADDARADDEAFGAGDGVATFREGDPESAPIVRRVGPRVEVGRDFDRRAREARGF